MKYIIYCRKSTDEKDKQVLSIESQVAELAEFANREGLEVVECITEAKTAKVPGREQFAEVLQKIEKGFAQGIISWHPDRLARNSIDGGKIIYLLDTGKLLDLKFPTSWFENTPQGKFMLSIAFGQSKYYIDNLGENVKRGNRQKLRRGEWPTKAPFGYFNDPKKNTIEIDPEKSRIIKKAYQLFAEGNKSFTEMSLFLHKFGIARVSRKYIGRPLKVDTIKRILTNKFYIGIMKHNGEYYQGSHKLFISKQLFDIVGKKTHKFEKPRKNGYNFAFRGLARCGECGAAITAETHIKYYKETDREVEYIYYRCTKKLKPCTQKYIDEPELGKQVRKVISDCALPQKWANEWYKWLDEDEKQEQLLAEENISKLKVELELLDKKLNILLDSFLDQVIDDATYKKKKNELFGERLKKEEEISKLATNGSTWLEPFREFIGSALSCAKIARAKNTCSDLASGAKTVGSNFFLTNRRLVPTLNKGFAELCAPDPAQSQLSGQPAISLSARPDVLTSNTNCA